MYSIWGLHGMGDLIKWVFGSTERIGIYGS